MSIFSRDRLAHTTVMAIMASLLAACTWGDENQTRYSGDMVLALSWQPGFCETRPRLPECKSQKRGRFDTTHFSLHGLWPQPARNQYCGVDKGEIKKDKARRWKNLQGLGLSDATKKKLWEIMPGARSYLHRHEWVKHGTCYSGDAETYFEDSLILMEAVNQSAVQSFFESNIGKRVNNQAIRSVFDQTFGDGVGSRVRVACKRDGKRTIITELTLGISGEITPDVDIAKLALASPETKAGCPVGIIDPVGFQ